MKKIISFVKNIFLSICSLVLLYMILEGGAYLIIKAYPTGYYESDVKNSLGLRDPREPSDILSDNVILVLGDSFTYGTGIKYHESYSAQFEKKMKLSYPTLDIAVINGGTPGFNTKMSYNRLKEIFDQYNPQYVIIGMTAGDIVEDQVDYRKLDKTVSPKINSADVDKTTQVKINKREETYSKLIYLRSYLLFKSNAVKVISFYYKNYLIKYIKIPGFLKNMRAEAGFSEEFEATEYFLDKITSFLSDRNKEMILLFNIPLFRFDTFPYENINVSLRTYAETRNIHYINTYDTFSKYKSSELWVSIEDGHYNAKANNLIAEALKDFYVDKLQRNQELQ